jgi:hypothetical protein
MKPFWVKTTVMIGVLLVSGAASATTTLTPRQCNDYPFTPLSKPVTHAQLMQELSELESVGYQASSGDDSYYPSELQEAEARLRLKYRADCLGEKVKVPTTPIIYSGSAGGFY